MLQNREKESNYYINIMLLCTNGIYSHFVPQRRKWRMGVCQ